jgi:hypothetical protein
MAKKQKLPINWKFLFLIGIAVGCKNQKLLQLLLE